MRLSLSTYLRLAFSSYSSSSIEPNSSVFRGVIVPCLRAGRTGYMHIAADDLVVQAGVCPGDQLAAQSVVSTVAGSTADVRLAS